MSVPKQLPLISLWLTVSVSVIMKIMRPSTEPPSSHQDGRAAPAQNVVIVPAEPESRYWRNYASESSLLLGIAHIVIGILCIMCNLVAIGAQSPTAVAGHGIWGGAFVRVPNISAFVS